MLRCLPFLLAVSLLASPAFAAQEAPAAPETEIITVRGERSGPQLWRITHPEREGEVYVFITVPWVPASLERPGWS